ncbi:MULTISPECIES: LysR family transcriptional regulator [unclassified Methylophaga]|jgi:DNA-binding transcriptional LysR family regulator|uniref:LysR family transcriptional regulator n=2 Tax=Methylophaga TaxID=40222 RepID=UPI0023B6777F|nr:MULTISPECIES: LysR family transcriptional regulator [unclassified Methylophaga]|tara:strand:+ start:1755 stop:2675 length:921 start_codon:yes stop_codon:yes gene_type:complete
MSMNVLKVFVAVAQAGSFVAASRVLDLPPSSVSRYIAGLEKSLGQRLFYRHTRAVKLTEVGEIYFAEVREALISIELATELAKGSALVPQGNLKINAPVSFGRLHLTKLLHKFQRQYKDINIELVLTDSYIDPIIEGVDVVIRIGGMADSSLNYKKIANEKYDLCAAPEYVDSMAELSEPKGLIQHNCLIYKGSMGRRSWFFRPNAEAKFEGIEVTGNLYSNNADILVDAAVAGQGIVLFPRWLISKYLQSGELVPLLQSWEASEKAEPQKIYALYPANRLKSSKVRYFLDAMSGYFGEEKPYWDA